jgi:hypothetical protein
MDSNFVHAHTPSGGELDVVADRISYIKVILNRLR